MNDITSEKRNEHIRALARIVAHNGWQEDADGYVQCLAVAYGEEVAQEIDDAATPLGQRWGELRQEYIAAGETQKERVRRMGVPLREVLTAMGKPGWG